jgi:23S rRNA (cytosine1962-C5)-methyltransferase
MMESCEVVLKKGRAASVGRGHPWIFSGAIERLVLPNDTQAEPPVEGDWVRVTDAQGRPIGWGHWGEATIAVRVLERTGRLEGTPNSDWWAGQLQSAIAWRRRWGLISGEQTNCCRLVHGEGDGLSGLIVDWYGGIAVIQTHTLGMHRALPQIVAGLKFALGGELKGIASRSGKLLKSHGDTLGTEMSAEGWIEPPTDDANGVTAVVENGLSYEIDVLLGQKTGFYLDQRDNRDIVRQFAAGRDVLNAFSYTGGFSLAALAGGAKSVVSLDASAPALEICEKNVALNEECDDAKHSVSCGDVLAYVRGCEALPDLVILDPPAYAKSRSARHRAVQGYKRLNLETLKRLPTDALLFTFSCSQVVDAGLFEDTIIAAAIESGRNVRIIKRLGQPTDHPISAFHPEGAYLKGLLLAVD